MKKKVLTGIKPTADQLHLGNYLGAIKPMIDYQNSWEYEIYFFVATMHAFTQLHDWEAIRRNLKNLVKLYIACGVDPEKTVIYNQTDIAAHAQLHWVLSCITTMGFMERMHAYKDSLAKGTANEVSVGTFCYPILQAADIVLYDVDLVPIGKDQKQHVEFSRDIAQKFNRLFGETFVLPAPLVDENVATILWLDGRKMSKSYNNFIWLLDDEKTVLKKIKIISTDTKSVEEVKNPDEDTIYAIVKHFISPEEDNALRQKYLAGGFSYKEAKEYAFEKIWAFLTPIQQKYATISDEQVEKVLKEWAEKMWAIAQKKITEVYQKIGF